MYIKRYTFTGLCIYKHADILVGRPKVGGVNQLSSISSFHLEFFSSTLWTVLSVTYWHLKVCSVLTHRPPNNHSLRSYEKVTFISLCPWGKVYLHPQILRVGIGWVDFCRFFVTYIRWNIPRMVNCLLLTLLSTWNVWDKYTKAPLTHPTKRHLYDSVFECLTASHALLPEILTRQINLSQ
jgi:hypothetical protein